MVIDEIQPDVLNRLRLRARESGRPLEAELRSILERASECDWISAAPELDRVRALFVGRVFSDSTHLLQEDRVR
ncbi:MAG: FitA-like ribbon-helix-helix domain-containing protein [Capsulimonadaceae bacterium]